MCRLRDALRHRRQAAEGLAAACLARVPDPQGETLALAYPIDPLVPPDMSMQLARIGEGKKT